MKTSTTLTVPLFITIFFVILLPFSQGATCDGLPFDPNYEACCGGKIYTPSFFTQCCGNDIYDPHHDQVCCNSVVYSTLDDKECCDGIVGAVVDGSCCGVTYNTETEHCCNGVVRPYPISFPLLYVLIDLNKN